MARYFVNGEIVGEPDPVTSTIDWVRSELDYAKSIDLNPCVVGRIDALTETLYHLEREADACSG